MSNILERQITDSIALGKYEQAFNFILSGYKQRLYWHIRNMVLIHEDADDVLQEVYIKIWKNLPVFEGRSQVFSWIYRIATNEALTFLSQRKKKQSRSLDDENGVANTLVSDTYFDGDYAHALLLEAVSKLPDKQKQVFTLKYFEELKYEQISEITETSVGGLKASYHHAVNKVEEYLKSKAD